MVLLCAYWILTSLKIRPIPIASTQFFINYDHWIIAKTYIQAFFEARMLINKDTYTKSSTELVSVQKFKCWLTTANISIVILILLISIGQYLQFILVNIPQLGNINTLLTLAFQLGCSIAWAWTLIRLHKDIKHSEKLLPNKRIFIQHGTLLSIYFILFFINALILLVSDLTDDKSTRQILLGTNGINECFLQLFEYSSFFLAVKMMLPIT